MIIKKTNKKQSLYVTTITTNTRERVDTRSIERKSIRLAGRRQDRTKLKERKPIDNRQKSIKSAKTQHNT